MSSNDHKTIEQKRRFINIFHNPLTAWIVLGASLILTFAAYSISNNFVTQRAEDRFNFRAIEIEEAIKERLRIYEQLLWSGVGMIYTQDNVNRVQFAKFVEAMDIENHWPGIQGFGFSIPVKPQDKQAHIDAIRAEGFPDFTITPEGTRDMYSSIIYLEPFDWRNKRAFGYDMWSNDMRREAMTRARDGGAAATSGIITLVQETEEDVQRGFLTYVPVYKTKTIPKTVKERKDQFVGWVYAPYRAGNLMTGVVGTEDPSIKFEVFDGESMNEEALLFDSDSNLHLDETNHNPDFKKISKVTNQGRAWTLYFNTPKDYLSSGERNQPRFVAIAGVIVDILLFYVIYSLYFINRRAEEMAKDMTKELERSTEKLEIQVKERTSELQKSRDGLEEKAEELTALNRQLRASEQQLQVSIQQLRASEKKLSSNLEELQKVHEDLKQTQAMLIQAGKLTAIGQLGAGIAHELNQPLAVIRGYTQVMIKEIKEDNPYGSDLKMIDDQTHQMSKIINNIRSFARDSKMTMKLIDIHKPIDNALMLFTTQLKTHNIEIIREYAQNVPKINGDNNQLQQVFINLISNARDELEKKGEGKLWINTRLVKLGLGRRKTDLRVEISFKNEGMTIPEGVIDRIFDPFFTTKGPGKGTGLGLSISYGIIKNHHGEILVANKEDGVEFLVQLPVYFEDRQKNV